MIIVLLAFAYVTTFWLFRKMAAFLVAFLWRGLWSDLNKIWLLSHVDECCPYQKLKSLISQSKTNCLFRPPHIDKDLFVLFCELLIIIWLIQVKDGKLLDEMAVSMTGLANKVGRADICRSVQNQFPHSPQSSASGRSSRICTQETLKNIQNTEYASVIQS